MFDRYKYLRNKYEAPITFKVFRYYKERRVSYEDIKYGYNYRIFYMKPKSWKLGKFECWLPPKPRSCTGKFESEQAYRGTNYAYFAPFDLDLKVNSYGNDWFVLRLK